jgi:hypothetical protein
MKRYRRWLTGIAALALLAPLSGRADSASPLSATIETGGAGVGYSEDIKKVDEYSTYRTDNGVTLYGKGTLEMLKDGIALDGKFNFMGPRDQFHTLDLDVKRIFRSEFSYSVLNHWLDHDQLNYLDAAVPPGSSYTGSAANPLPLTPNSVPAFWYNPQPGTTTPAYGGGSSTAPVGYTAQQIGRAAVYGEDLTPDATFGIKRTELVSKSDLIIPQLPNMIFHFNYRNEKRSGDQQSIGMSKCTSCHVTGQSKNINEKTEDITAGVTGKFGLLTMDYSFMNREFRENAAAPERYYDPALSPGSTVPANYDTAAMAFDNRMLFDFRSGLLRYDETPDSSKNSHIAKAKVDLPWDTSVMASYVNSSVDSKKTGDSSFTFNGDNTTKLKTDYSAYGGKVTTKFGKDLSVTLRGRAEKLTNDDVSLQFDTMPLVPITSYGTAPNQFTPTTASLNPTRHSIIERDTFTGGIDAAYRLPLKTTLRLGYEYQYIDRNEHEFDTTTTNTFKVAVNSRPTKTLTARAGVTYKSIDDPYQNPDAALTPQMNNVLGSTVGNGPTYGVSLYDERTVALTNQPDEVIDANFATTWTPSSRYSITAMYHVKSEQNDLSVSNWKQDTHSPGISIWYAPAQKVSMTLSYNYLNQQSETAFCQGWYDG